MELFPPQEFDRKDIKAGIDFLKVYHSNKRKNPIMPIKELIKTLNRKSALVRLKLEVPQEKYNVDYQKQLEEFKSHTGLPIRPSVDELISRYNYGYESYQDVMENQDWDESLTKERKEIDKLVERMIPDDPLGKFFEFIEELKKDGKVSTIPDESEGSEKSDKDTAVHHELGAAHNVIKAQRTIISKLRKKEKFLLRDLSDGQLKEILYETKKRNGKPNYTKMGDHFGCHRTTVKSELKRRGIIF